MTQITRATLVSCPPDRVFQFSHEDEAETILERLKGLFEVTVAP